MDAMELRERQAPRNANDRTSTASKSKSLRNLQTYGLTKWGFEHFMKIVEDEGL